MELVEINVPTLVACDIYFFLSQTFPSSGFVVVCHIPISFFLIWFILQRAIAFLFLPSPWRVSCRLYLCGEPNYSLPLFQSLPKGFIDPRSLITSTREAKRKRRA